ncbi:MAG: RnfABCDGE type electron transport complex subunit D, partial [Deltaproteobacteria bacterium]|nr:RnfABCDGE type electron transport complex subunit D [Deltaproteobacteria bacterium]
MSRLRGALDRIAPHFEEGGRLERLHPVWEAFDTLLYTPGQVTRTGSHVRDALDYKRMMTIVVVALLPCFAMAFFNTGYQASLAIQAGAAPLGDWQNQLFQALGGRYDPASLLGCALLGALYVLPVYAVAMAAGIGIELVFAVVRRHEVSEGFFVTGALIPLILPPTIPLWQVALATVVGLVFSKEVFGGTGMNFMNPALVVRAILFFAYPADISGDA